MSENQNTNPQSNFVIHKLYTKKLAIEVPLGAEIFKNDKLPEVSVQLNNATVKLEEPFSEVTLTISVTAKVEDKILYTAEISQAGIFTIEGFHDEERSHIEGAYCPGVLFPYLRESLDNLVIKAGFPPLTIAPVNFDMLYAKRLEQMKTQGNA